MPLHQPLLERGKEAFWRGNYAEALGSLSRVAEERPDYADLRNRLGVALHFRAGRSRPSSSSLRDSGGGRRRARIGAAGLAAGLAALAALSCAAAGEDHLQKGNRFLAEGKVQDARAEFRIALRGSRRPPEELLWKLGLLDLNAKDLTEAREELDALVRRDEDRRSRVARLWLLFAARWFKAGDPFTALQAVEAARATDPDLDLGPFHYELADAHFDQGDHERAVESYLLALASAPGVEPEATWRLAVALERLGRWRQALRYFRAYAAAGGERAGDREFRYHLGEAAFRSAQASFLDHRYGEAREELELVLEAGQPETLLDDAWYLLGELRYRTGDHQAAEAAFQRVLELSPSPSSRLYGEAERRLLDIRIGDPAAEEPPGVGLSGLP